MYKRLATAATAAVLIGSVTACGSSGSAADSNDAGADSATKAKAAASIEGTTEVPTTIGIDAQLSSKPPAGKTIIALTNGSAVSQLYMSAMKKGADALGWTFKSLNTGTTPESEQAAMKQAVQLHPDGIMYSAIAPAVLSKQLEAAKAAGIPVVPIAQTEAKVEPMIDNTIADPTQVKTMAKALAAYIVAHSKKAPNILLVGLPVYPVQVLLDQAFTDAVKEWCADCKVTVAKQQLTDLGTKTPGNIVSAIQRERGINWIVMDHGAEATGVAAALRAANLTDQVQIAGINPSADSIAALKEGADAVWATYAIPIIGYRVIDDFARHFTGDSLTTAAGKLLPWMLMTPEVTKTLELAPDGTWWGPSDTLDQFKKLWNVG
jgi:ribose transport system substrate-binding protein